jgi:hypothetical protein
MILRKDYDHGDPRRSPGLSRPVTEGLRQAADIAVGYCWFGLGFPIRRSQAADGFLVICKSADHFVSEGGCFSIPGVSIPAASRAIQKASRAILVL